MSGKVSILLVVGILVISAFPMLGITSNGVMAPPSSPSPLSTQSNYSIEQAISDQAQLNTLAFDGLGFITGDLFTDSFLPPGKVADFFGFQYLRDCTPNGNGHNTSFVTNCANNVLVTLNATQKGWMTALANSQGGNVNQFAKDRYPLMVGFRRNMDKDYPANSSGLSREAVMDYSADLYGLDANISMERAQLYANVINSLNTSQKQFFDDMVEGGFDSWPIIPDQVDKKNWSKDVCVLVMTYASELFGWYAGNVTADTYFCPERQADYFGGFFIKDAPAIGNASYKINESITGEKGQKFLDALDATQRALVTGLVDTQRGDIRGIVEKRMAISTELRVALAGGSINTSKVTHLARAYGRLDGEISYFYATVFSKVNATLTAQQRAELIAIKNLTYTPQPNKIFLYSDLIDRPAIRNTDFLFMMGRALPDTGQTGNYTATFGEDSDYLINPPAFTDNGDGTLTDNITGLMWQKTDGGEMTWDSAKTYAQNLVLGGHDDWRLPTSLELFNILDLGRRSPAINSSFIVTGAEYWWSCATEVDDASKVWSANAGGGIGPHPKTETISAGGTKSFHAICVRGADPSTELGYGLDDNYDGTIADDSTGLMWQQATAANMTWEHALAYCENLTLGGYSDWRLPNVKELRSISNDSLHNPSINTSMFTGALSSKYWSSTTEINDPSRAWYVDFAFGLVSYQAKNDSLPVRAIRGGGAKTESSTPSVPPTNATGLVISATTRMPMQPNAADIVNVTTHVSSVVGAPTVALNYQTINSSTRASLEIPVFCETMGTVEVKPWKGNGSDNQWTILATNPDSIEQRKEANYGLGNPCGMEFGTGTNNLTDTMVENAQGIDARGNGTSVEFYLWADGLEGADGWTFQLDSGSGFVTRLSELTGSNHAWQKYHYDLLANESVEGLKMRFQFRAGEQGDRIRIDLIYVNVTISGTASSWSSVPMADDGAHGDGAAADGTYGANIPAFPNGTTVRYYVSATANGGLSAKDPPMAPLIAFSYAIIGAPVLNSPPTVLITEPLDGATVKDLVTIKGTSADIDIGDIITVYVKIDDGNWTEASGGVNWSLPWNTTSYTNAEHTISARAHDGNYNSTVVSINVTVDNPVVVINHTLEILSYAPTDDPTINETESVNFSVVAVDSLVHDLTYSWSVDGNMTEVTSDFFEYTTGYDDSGEHTVKMSVRGLDGICNLSAEHEWAVTVLNVNRAPTGLIVAPLDGAEFKTGADVEFNASGSDPDGQSVTFNWDFGDGQEADGKVATHKYADNGTYTVTMTISDGFAFYNATISVKVTKAEPNVTDDDDVDDDTVEPDEPTPLWGNWWFWLLIIMIVIVLIMAAVIVILVIRSRGKTDAKEEPKTDDGKTGQPEGLPEGTPEADGVDKAAGDEEEFGTPDEYSSEDEEGATTGDGKPSEELDQGLPSAAETADGGDAADANAPEAGSEGVPDEDEAANEGPTDDEAADVNENSTMKNPGPKDNNS